MRGQWTVLLVVLVAMAGCGEDAEQASKGSSGKKEAAKKTGPLPTFDALVDKGATPSICGGSFEPLAVSPAGEKVGVQGIAVAECTAGKEIQQLALVEAKSEAEAPELSMGVVYTFAGKDAGQASIGGNVTCVTDESKAQREICSRPLGRLVLVAVSPEGNRSLGSPAEIKGLPEFERWLEGQRSG